MVAVAERPRALTEFEPSEFSDGSVEGGETDLARIDGDLTDAINREHSRVETAKQKTIQHAVRCGELLIEMKRRVGHGNWLTWIEEHFDASERTARNYMEIAKLAAVADLDADVTMRSALRALATPSRSKRPQLLARPGETSNALAGTDGTGLNDGDRPLADAEISQTPRAGLPRTDRRTWTGVPARLAAIGRAFSEAAADDLDDRRASQALYQASREAQQAAADLERLAVALEKRSVSE